MGINARYDPYIKRVKAITEDLLAGTGHRLSLPSDLDYRKLLELSTEERERLAMARPGTIGAAAMLEGVTATGLAVLLRHARKGAVGGEAEAQRAR